MCSFTFRMASLNSSLLKLYTAKLWPYWDIDTSTDPLGSLSLETTTHQQKKTVKHWDPLWTVPCTQCFSCQGSQHYTTTYPWERLRQITLLQLEGEPARGSDGTCHPCKCALGCQTGQCEPNCIHNNNNKQICLKQKFQQKFLWRCKWEEDLRLLLQVCWKIHRSKMRDKKATGSSSTFDTWSNTNTWL